MSGDSRDVRPLEAPVDATVRLPGSKSETIRALAAAALADGRSHIYGGLHADDPVAMAGAVDAFGVAVNTTVEPWTVDGRAGRLDAPDGVDDAASLQRSSRGCSGTSLEIRLGTVRTGH